MKYSILLLFSISLSFCSCSVVLQNSDQPDNYFDTIEDDFSLKYHVNKRIQIPELKNVNNDEPELGNLLKLPWRLNDPYVFFCSLADDLLNEKNKYENLFSPLVLFLYNTFNSFDEKQTEYSEYSFNSFEKSFENRLADICIRKGHYDLVFKVLEYFPEDLVKIISESKVGNRKELMEFFKENPNFILIFKKNLLKMDNNDVKARWIADCIVFNAPEAFYIDLVTSSPIILTFLINDLFLSLEVPESEYSRIYSQIKKLFTEFWTTEKTESFQKQYEFCNMLNDIRFCPDAPQKLILSSFENRDVIILAKAALLGHKQDLFMKICTSPMDQAYKILNEILSMKKATSECEQVKKFKTIFDLVSSRKNVTEVEQLYLDFTLKFYAIDHFKVENDRVIMEFVPLKSLQDLNFPKIIRANIKSQPKLESFIFSIFEHMKVFTEQTISSFLTDYATSPMFRRDHPVSIELIEFISESPKLQEQFHNLGMKLGLASTTENVKRFFNLTNYRNLTQILNLVNPTYDQLITLKSDEQLKAFESLSGKSVPEFFFSFQENPKRFAYVMNEIDYAEWHVALIYWIKSDQSDQMRNITSQIIKDMLKSEFPKEMGKIIL